MGMQQFPSEAARIAAEQAAQQVVQDPSVWARFLGPVARGVSTGLETLDAPFEFVKQQALAPIVEGLTQSLPVRWQPGPGALNFDWNPDAWVTPEGKFSPSAMVHNIGTLVPPIAALETKAVDPIFAAPGTRRYQNIQQEIARREQKFGRPLSEMEIRQTGEELYKLPPFMRGTLEELPYFMVPPAGVLRAGSAAARAGKMLRPAGRLAKGVEGPVQPAGTLARQAPGVAAAARGALKVGEAALKPIDILERGTMKAISLPARGLVRGATAVGAPVARKTSDWGTLRTYTNELRNDATQKIKEGVHPEDALGSANRQYADSTNTGVTDRFALRADDSVVENPNTNVPGGAKVLDDVIAREKGLQEGILPEQVAEGKPAADMDVPAPDNREIPQTPKVNVPKGPVASVVTDSLESSKFLNPVVMAKQKTNKMLDSFARLSAELGGKVPYIQRLNTGRTADNYVSFMNKYHNGQFLLTNLQDAFWRSTRIIPGRIFEPGGKFDVVTKARLAAGAKKRGIMIHSNFLNNSLLPAVSTHNIDRLDIDRLLFGKRSLYVYDENRAWNQLDETQNRGPLRFLDYEFDAKGDIVNKQGVIVDRATAESWTDLTENGALFKKYSQKVAAEDPSLSPEAIAAMAKSKLDVLSDVAKDARDIMRFSRRRQFETRVIGREFFESYDMTDEEIAELAAEESGQIKELWNMYQSATNAERRALQNTPAPNETSDAIERANVLLGRAGATDDAAREAARKRIKGLVDRYEDMMEGKIPTPRGREIREPWYIPMSYIETASTRSGLLRPGSRGGGALSKNAWDEFADIPAEAADDLGYTAKPFTGEVMQKHLMADEVRAAENDLLLDMDEMGIFTEHGLKDVSDQYLQNVLDQSHVYDAVSESLQLGGTATVRIEGIGGIANQLEINDIRGTNNEIKGIVDKMVASKILKKEPKTNEYSIIRGADRPAPEFKRAEKPLPGYNEDTKSGIITFFRDGERVVLAANDQGGSVDPLLWNTIYGRGGLSVRGSGSKGLTKKSLAFSNGFFRGALTTFNPLFIVKNIFIDMFTGTMVGGLSVPHESMVRLAKSAAKAASEGEDRFMEIYMGGAGLQAKVFDPTPAQYQKVSKAVDDARHDTVIIKNLEGPARERELERVIKDAAKEMMGIDNATWGGKKLVEGIKPWKTVPAVGTLAEQSVRYVVARKSFKRQLERKFGNKRAAEAEYKRLMKMDRRDWEYELFTNWNNTGRGLVDSAEAKAAAISGVQSTLDFQRGGDMIRELNQYILFLNAAMEGPKQPFRAMGVRLLPKVKMKTYEVDDATELITDGPFKGLRVSDEKVPKYEFLAPGEGMFRGGVTTEAFETGTGGPKSVALRVGAALGAYTYIQMVWNKQWEYQGIPLYYDVPEYVRNNAIVVMMPPPKDENGEYIMDVQTGRPKLRYIVMPHRLREWNMIFQPTNFMIDSIRNDVPRDFNTFALGMFEDQSPIGGGLPMPEAIRYGISLYSGQDSFRDQPIVDTALKSEIPPEQYDTRSSEAVIQFAEAMYDAPLPDWIKDRAASPKKAEHFFTGATGGAGQMALSFADLIVRNFEDLRNDEARPMEERIAEYREMDRTSRKEFVAGLNAKDYKLFQKELRRPREQIPFFTKMLNTYAPGAADPLSDYSMRGGGLRQIGRRMTEEAFPEISTQETRDAGIMARKVNDQLRIEQQRLDTELDKWNTKNTTGIDPTKWIEGRKAKKYMQKGSLLALGEMFDESIYAEDDATRDAYYESLYTAAGQIADIRDKSELLIAAYYAIEPEGEHPESADWAKFYATRDEFMQKLRTSSESSGDKMYENFLRDLQASMTDMERSYDNARRYLSTYWNLGKDVSQLTSNPSARLQEQWDEYNNLPNMAQKDTFAKANPHIDQLRTVRTTLRKMLIKQDLDRSGSANLDSVLVYWYGGKGWHKGYTDEGKAYWNRLYATTATGFIPRNPMTEN